MILGVTMDTCILKLTSGNVPNHLMEHELTHKLLIIVYY